MNISISGNETAAAMMTAILNGRVAKHGAEQAMSEIFGLMGIVEKETGTKAVWKDRADSWKWDISEIDFVELS